MNGTDGGSKDLLAVSTEDGRILFYDTTKVIEDQASNSPTATEIPVSTAFCQLGGTAEGFAGRVKDFEILKPPDSDYFIIVTGSSDGAIRLWTVEASEFVAESSVSKELTNEVSMSAKNGEGKANGNAMNLATTGQVGSLLGAYEAGNRITCLKAFVMSEPESPIANGLENGIAGKHGKESASTEEANMSN